MSFSSQQIETILGPYVDEAYDNTNRVMKSGILNMSNPEIEFREGPVNSKRRFTATNYTTTRSTPTAGNTVLSTIGTEREYFVRYADSFGTEVDNIEMFLYNQDAVAKFGRDWANVRMNIENKQLVKILTGVSAGHGATSGYGDLQYNIARTATGAATDANQLSMATILAAGRQGAGDHFALRDWTLLTGSEGVAPFESLNVGNYRNQNQSMLTQASADVPGMIMLPNGLDIFVDDTLMAFAAGQEIYNNDGNVDEGAALASGQRYADVAAAIAGVNAVWGGTNFAATALDTNKVIRMSFLVKKGGVSYKVNPMGTGVKAGPERTLARGSAGAMDLSYRFENIMHVDGCSWSSDAAHEFPGRGDLATAGRWTPQLPQKQQNVITIFHN